MNLDGDRKAFVGEALVRAERLQARLVESLGDATPLSPISVETLQTMDRFQRLVLDAYLKRFQDAYETGKSLFRSGLLLAGLGWPKLNYIDLVNEAERYGVLPSAMAWLDIRDMRNSVAHEYVMRPAEQAKLLTEAVACGGQLTEQLGAAIDFVRSRLAALD